MDLDVLIENWSRPDFDCAAARVDCTPFLESQLLIAAGPLEIGCEYAWWRSTRARLNTALLAGTRSDIRPVIDVDMRG